MDLKWQPHPRHSNVCAVSIEGVMRVPPPSPVSKMRSAGENYYRSGSVKSRSMVHAKASVGLALSCLSSASTAVADATVTVEEAKARMKHCLAKLEEAREKERLWVDLLNEIKSNLYLLEKDYEVINVDEEE